MVFAALFGNPNIEKILLFLLVNEKCYATQLCQSLRGSLTPIQQALLRLEKGNILTSTLEGKTRLFRFNPRYPFLRELQTLLKEGYHQLPLHDQQAYYAPQSGYPRAASKTVKQNKKSVQEKMKNALPQLWQRLLKIKKLSFSAQSKAVKQSGWNGVGQATVRVEAPASHCLVFHEQGVWKAEDGKEFDFKNQYRWTWNKAKSLIALEHLRHGAANPVFLFELTPVGENSFETVHPFLCRHDTYLATLNCTSQAIEFNWRILGPNKNEEIHYVYL